MLRRVPHPSEHTKANERRGERAARRRVTRSRTLRALTASLSRTHDRCRNHAERDADKQRPQ
jgi:hypothetical protein